MNNFREALEDCGLKDLGFVGSCFTWTNKRSHPNFIRERLDRCVGHLDWRNLFPYFTVMHLDFWKSDHKPVILSFEENLAMHSKGMRRFFYDRCWEDREDCLGLVESSWEGSVPFTDMGKLVGNLARCARRFQVWSWKNKKEFQDAVSGKRKVLAQLQSAASGVNWEAVRRTEDELNELLKIEEIYWQ